MIFYEYTLGIYIAPHRPEQPKRKEKGAPNTLFSPRVITRKERISFYRESREREKRKQCARMQKVYGKLNAPPPRGVITVK